MRSLIVFELKHYLNNIKEIAYIYTGFVFYVLVFAFAMGPESQPLATHGQVAIWLALLFSVLGSQNLCFQEDDRNHLLDFWRIYPVTLEGVMVIKLLIYIIFILTPLMFLAPLSWGMMGIVGVAFWPFLTHITIVAIGLCAVNFMVAAMMTGLSNAAAITVLIAGPLCVPLLIFGMEAASAPFLGSNASVIVAALAGFYASVAWFISAWIIKE
jgi:heme exporter protein B